MERAKIKDHWTGWARRYGTDIRATTVASTAKMLEIDALKRAISSLQPALGDAVRVLEPGCGNGHNCVELARAFPGFQVTGFDYVDEMVECARLNAVEAGLGGRVTFEVADLLVQDAGPLLTGPYDLIYTDRCLINLGSTDAQKRAIGTLTRCLSPDGHLLMLENSLTTYERQNDCREMLGLPRRHPAEFNTFLDDTEILPFLHTLFDSVRLDDFSGLHDLLLYVLLPAANGGEIDYGHPLVELAAELSQEMSASGTSPFGGIGQNRLYVCQRAPR